MTTIYLIRHGELAYTYNEHGQKMLYGPDITLSEVGRNQMRALADRFAKEGRSVDAIYTSPYPRAAESGEIFGAVFGIKKINPVNDFRDIDNSGPSGITMDEVLARKGDFATDSRVESLEHLAARMYEALRGIVFQEPDKTIAIVSHGDAIRTLLFRLEHPNDEIPPMTDISTYDYLDKGEAWRLQLDRGLSLTGKEYIGRPLELWGKGERKS